MNKEPTICPFTEEISRYREDFKEIMKGWEWSGVEEVLEKIKEEVMELVHARDMYASSLKEKEKVRLLAELADVIIVSMPLLDESEVTLSDIINSRLRSNIDRADRAAEAAKIKGTTPKEEWGTTKRSFEL